MRIVESRAIALTVRPPRPAPETMPTVAPKPARAAAPRPRPCADPVGPALPEAGFVMQLIAAAATRAEAGPPPTRAVGRAYGDAGRAMSPAQSGGRVARSI